MEEGEPLNYRRWKKWNCARRALQAAENATAEREGRKPVELPHMVTHDLRHFFASALIAGGASVKQVQLVLGHASASSRCGSTRTCGRAKKTAPGPSWTPFLAPCGPGADR